AADHHEAAAVVADVVPDLRHLWPRQLEGRHVGEHDAVVLLQPRDVLRDPRRLDDGDLDVLRAQRGRQRRGVRAVAVGEQDLRPAADDDGAHRAVVVLDGIALHVESGLVDVDAALVQGLPVGEHALPGADEQYLWAAVYTVMTEKVPRL